MLMRVFGLFLVPLTLLIAPLAFGAEASHDRLDLTSKLGRACLDTHLHCCLCSGDWRGTHSSSEIQAGDSGRRYYLGDDCLGLRAAGL